MIMFATTGEVHDRLKDKIEKICVKIRPGIWQFDGTLEDFAKACDEKLIAYPAYPNCKKDFAWDIYLYNNRSN